MKAASVGFQCPSCVKEGAATVRPAKAAYGGAVRATPFVTYALIGLNAAVFLATTLTGTGLAFGGNPSSLFLKLCLIPSTVFPGFRVPASFGQGVAQGEYYRLLTSTFLHFGLIHLALNMYCLHLLGPALERAFGMLRFTGLYLLSGLSGAMLSYALGPSFETAAGASGAVFGLFGAFFVLQRKRGGDVTQIATTIGINLFISFAASSYIDWRGHVGGLIGGSAVGAAIVYAPAGSRRWVYQAAGGAGVLLLVVVGVALRTSALTSP
jgi:membrane associated rhomboid family serine protease